MPAPVVAHQARRRWRRAWSRSPHDTEILRLAIPAFGALVAEPLFLLADAAIVGRLGTAPLGGLGVASQVLSTGIGLAIFLAYGTTAAVARQLGAGQHRAAIRQGIDGLWLAILIGLLVLGAGWPSAGLIGAGDQDYLALAGLAATAVFGAAAAAVLTRHGGLAGLWLSLSAWMAARFGTLTLRARGRRWLVTGAVRP